MQASAVPSSRESARPGARRARVLLSLGALLLALALVEGGLRVYTWWMITRRLAPLTLPQGDGGLIYVLGDSVPYGYGLDPEQAWPAQLRALLAKRGGSYEVYNAAEPGASLGGLRERQLQALSRVTPGTPLIALFQVGHNDRTSLMFNGRAVEEDEAAVGAIWSELRLVHLYRSFEERRRRWEPPANITDEGRAVFSRDLGTLCRSFTDRGGTCILMTYPLCGVIGQERPSDYALAHNRVHAAQITVNQLIRWSGHALGLHVLDVAQELPLSASWSADECIDAVHPTGPIHGRIAELVADTLEK